MLVWQRKLKLSIIRKKGDLTTLPQRANAPGHYCILIYSCVLSFLAGWLMTNGGPHAGGGGIVIDCIVFSIIFCDIKKKHLEKQNKGRNNHKQKSGKCNGHTFSYRMFFFRFNIFWGKKEGKKKEKCNGIKTLHYYMGNCKTCCINVYLHPPIIHHQKPGNKYPQE